MKKVETVVEDIYKKIAVLGQGKPIKVEDKDIDKFGEFMKDALRDWLTPRVKQKPTLRMSNIGKPLRQLWFDINSKDKAHSIPPATMIKFLYGHILERLVLFLTELAGHNVTDEQKEVEVNKIVGHMDCKIDGEVVDIKSASRFAFQKFVNGTLADSDPFGYLAQLTGYEETEGTDQGGFLVINKESGELCFFRPEELDKPNIRAKINSTRKAIKKASPPTELCYQPTAEGTYGNYKIHKLCNYCPHKFECHKNSNGGKGLRVFRYAKGPAYFTDVVREPSVNEITDKYK